MQNSRDLTLYNVMFPIWMLWLFPLTWLIILPVNFAIDLAVVVLTLKVLQVTEIKLNAKRVILRVWLMGFAADMIGTALMFLTNILEFHGTPFGEWWYENLSNAVSFNPFDNIFSFLWVTVCVAVSAFCIYWFNRKFCLKKAELEDGQKHKLSLSLALLTAPYLFYFPSAWIY